MNMALEFEIHNVSRIGICIGIGIDIGIGIGNDTLVKVPVDWLHVCFTDCRCVWLTGYTSALQIAYVFGSAWFHMIRLVTHCKCVWFPGDTSALPIADVFGSVWFRMILPGYTFVLQIANVFGFGSALVCMHMLGLHRNETPSKHRVCTLGCQHGTRLVPNSYRISDTVFSRYKKRVPVSYRTGFGAVPGKRVTARAALEHGYSKDIGYEVNKYLRSPINETSASSLAPLTPEEIKVDKIMLSWILFTLSDSLRARIVVARPKSAKEAWSLIFDIVNDNKRSRTNTLKADLDAHVNEEDMVHYSLEGLPDTYNQVCGYIHWKDTFPDLKAVRSLLIAEEMRLKSKVLALPVDSSSPMVIVAETSTNLRSSTSQGRGTSENTTNDLLTKLLAQLGHLGMNVAMSNNGTNVTLPTHATVTPTVTGPNIASNVPTAPHAFYASPVHTTMGSVLSSGVVNTSGQATLLPQASTARTLHDPTTVAWNMDTGASSHLNNFVTSLITILNSCMYSTVSVGDGHSIPVTNTVQSILSTPLKFLRLNNVLITPDIDFMTRRVLLRCDSTGDLYPVTAPSPIPSAFLVSQQTWHQRLGHPGSEVLRRLVFNNVISYNKEKPPVLCHACQLGKHVRLPFVSSSTIVSSCFEIVHSDVWITHIESIRF
ncbi:ribonuclease H-like domain-containing protein [Tanacetum coccineum]|uniref:Ribonuclease H-like domain-containing protein n=1 Tax=Tanacetum coccineum TaxID=301880 RepID=A0ABQ5CY31_9ASTR